MIPAGQITDDTIGQCSVLLKPGDVVVDGGNSNYRDTIRHAGLLQPYGIELVDCGTSGGIWGLEDGYSLMIGGKPRSWKACGPFSKPSRREALQAGVMWALTAPGILSKWFTMESSTA